MTLLIILYCTAIALCLLFAILTYRRAILLAKLNKDTKEADKMRENARKSLEDAIRQSEEIRHSAPVQKFYRHYAIYPLGETDPQTLTDERMKEVTEELAQVIARRVKKYYPPVVKQHKGQRCLMIDLDIATHVNAK